MLGTPSTKVFFVVHVGVCTHPSDWYRHTMTTVVITPPMAMDGSILLSCIPEECSTRPTAMNSILLKTACPSRCRCMVVDDTRLNSDSTPTCHAVE